MRFNHLRFFLLAVILIASAGLFTEAQLNCSGGPINCTANWTPPGGAATITGSLMTTSSVTSSGDLAAAGASALFWTGRSIMRSPSDGIITLTNNGESAFTRLNLGGNTIGFPAIARSGTSAVIQLADGSTGGGLTTPILNVTSAEQFNGVTRVVNVASNFTTSGVGTQFEPITGLSWILPATTALSVPIGCAISFSTGTSGATASFGLNFSQAPTNAEINGIIQTNTTTYAGGAATVTTATSSGFSGTLASTSTLMARLNAYIENPSQAASTVTVNVKTSTAANTITVKRGSYCRLEF